VYIGIIYAIKNTINKKVYIGQTITPLKIRFNKHKYEAKRGKKGCVKLYSAMRKYGLDSFYVETLGQTSNQMLLDYLEASYIDDFDSINNGYNIEAGGRFYQMSNVTKKKLSLALKKYFLSHPEAKENLSKHRKNVPNNSNTKIKLGEHLAPAFEIRLGQHLSVQNEIKPGQHLSPTTEFVSTLPIKTRIEIYRRYCSENISQQKLANEYNVTLNVVKYSVKLGKLNKLQSG